MKRSTFSALTAAILLSACATTADTFNFDKSREITADFDTTWESVIGYFAENNIPIATVEKDSGLIVARNEQFPVSETKKIASCGSGGLTTPVSGVLSVNVFVRPVSDDVTNVQVNTQVSQNWSGAYGTTGMNECNSNGELEGALLDRIERGTAAP